MAKGTISHIAAALSALLCCAALARGQGTDYTFNPPSGNAGFFRVALNWLPFTGVAPGPGDTATIPNLKTCTVDDARTTEIVTVDAGGNLTIEDNGALTIDWNLEHQTPLLTVDGTLIIKGTLTMTNSTPDVAPGPRLTVNGTVEFQKTGPATPSILYSQFFTFVIDGTGTILADGSAGHFGLIGNVAGFTPILEIHSGVTVKGSVAIECENVNPGMRLDGTFIVDNAADVMQIGVTDNLRFVRAAAGALFHVSAVATLGMTV